LHFKGDGKRGYASVKTGTDRLVEIICMHITAPRSRANENPYFKDRGFMDAPRRRWEMGIDTCTSVEWSICAFIGDNDAMRGVDRQTNSVICLLAQYQKLRL
jgi:hypothetical protein